MVTIFTRSALVFWGHNPSPDVHSITTDPIHGRQIVTWADVMETRRERQAEILRQRRYVERWKPWRLSVWWSPGYTDAYFFGGYHAWFDRPGKHEWIRYGSCELKQLFPLLLPFGNYDQYESRSGWQEWMEAFVKSYPASRKCGHPRGATVVWRRGRDVALKDAACRR